MTRDELDRRLTARIQDGFCWASEAPIEIFEENVTGEARVTCTFSSGAVGLVFRLEKVGFPFLRQAKSVDWLVLVHLPDGGLSAHLIECKRTVNQGKWHDIKEQMAASVTRGLALAGALGSEIRRFHCYTAYRNDRVSPQRSPDPVLEKLPVGPAATTRGEEADVREARIGELDWYAAEIRLDGLDVHVAHRRVQLEQSSGFGRIDLSV